MRKFSLIANKSKKSKIENPKQGFSDFFEFFI